MKKYLVLLFGILPFWKSNAQIAERISLTPQQIETRFLQQNLSLIARQMDIEQADLQIREAKLWENPELSLQQVNLWSTSSQRREEPIPGIWGDFGKNTQFSVELSQMIQSACKRRRLIQREKINREIVLTEFDETVRSLRTELRKTLSQIRFLQSCQNALQLQIDTNRELTEVYRKQVRSGNIAKNELIRLEAALIESESELLECTTELNAHLSALNVLLHIAPDIEIRIESDPTPLWNPDEMTFYALEEIALDARPDLQSARKTILYQNKNLAYEKSQRIPDFTVSASYDRRGGVWKDFVGFGVSAPLPLFNRNQTQIKSARITLQQSILEEENLKNVVANEVSETYKNYRNAYGFYLKARESVLFDELDTMLEIYTRNLIQKNIGMLEYMDFMEVYRTGKKTLFQSENNLTQTFEELQFAIGTDIQ